MFDVVTARDFYAMLVQDFDDFIDKPHSARRAMHCAISAYHLHEWVWADWLKADRQVRDLLNVQSKGEFVEWIGRANWHFPTVREIATGSKHFHRSSSLDAVRVQAAPFMFDTLDAGFDQGAWDGPIRYVQSSMPVGPKGQGYLLIDFGEAAAEHRFQPAAHVLEAVVRFWRDFLRRYRPGDDVPNSAHHVD